MTLPISTPVFANAPFTGIATTSNTADTGYGGTGGTAPTHGVVVADCTAQTVASVTTTSGSNVVTATSFPKVYPNANVTGTGIPPGTTVLYVSGGNCYLSDNCTASGTVSLVFQSNGIKIDVVTYIPVGTVASGVVNLFKYDGTTYFLYDQVLMSSASVSQTVAQIRYAKPYEKLEIAPGWQLVATVTTTQTAGVDVIAEGGAF